MIAKLLSSTKSDLNIARFRSAFQAQGDSDDARFEIVGTGTGSFHVAAVSLMPSNNVGGFRAEVIAALKQLHSGVYRWPGGNFVSGHEWRDAIGDPDKRPADYGFCVAYSSAQRRRDR